MIVNSKPSQITHHLVEQPMTLEEFLQQQELDIKSAELLRLGAVYVNKERVSHPQHLLFANDYIRLHRDPRRFPVGSVDWSQHIVREEKDFIIIDKPSGIPTHATLDNQIENAQYQIQNLLGDELFNCHRLDIGTSGLLVLARHKEFLVQFHDWQKQGFIKKYYVAQVGAKKLSTATLSDSLRAGQTLVHYMQPSLRSPKVLSREPVNGWQKCVLQILDIEKIDLELSWQIRLQLITGRTHQIRAQLSYEGFPVVGDALYGSPRVNATFNSDVFHLRCTQLKWLEFDYSLSY